jgi:adenine phosphoribosyltransferase
LDLSKFIRTIPDFPIEGILFKDITPLLLNGEAISEAAAQLADPFRTDPPDVIVAPEARGWVFATAMSPLLGDCGVAVARKAGKLPGETVAHTYELEYGAATIELHADSIKAGQRVLLVDDLLATGGTLLACEQLISQLGGQVMGAAFLIELDFLGGRGELGRYPVHTIVHYGAGE